MGRTLHVQAWPGAGGHMHTHAHGDKTEGTAIKVADIEPGYAVTQAVSATLGRWAAMEALEPTAAAEALSRFSVCGLGNSFEL